MRVTSRSTALRLLPLLVWGAISQSPADARGQRALREGEPGRHGGRLVVALRAEPRTLNPLVAGDGASREVIGTMSADLIHINRLSHVTEPALAKSWRRSPDGREYTLELRHDVRFSDGHPLDTDDVLFTFAALLDPRVAAPQRDLLIVGGQPVRIAKLGSHRIRLTLAQPYAAAERLFDSIAILPSHLLASAFQQGTLASAWTLNTPPAAIAGLGPFRLKASVPGQRLVLERNPYYWKADSAQQALPYLDELVFLFTGNEDAQVIRFQSRESDVIARVSAENFAILSREQAAKRYQLNDLGPGLEYNFLLFNQNDLTGKNLPQVTARQRWFADLRFRTAVSRAVDREGISRLVYRGRAVPLWGNMSPGNRRWVNATIARPPRSIEQARSLLQAAGFSWRDRVLFDSAGVRVQFTIATSSSNAQRTEMATLIQADLQELGMDVRVVPLEFRALLDRVYQTFDYDAVVLGLGGGDADPNSEMNVWLSRGGNHLWRLGQKSPHTTWEAEVDRLMEQQLITVQYDERRRLYDRVQALIAENLPFIFLASPNVLVGARGDLRNFQPAVLDPPTLWNAEQLFLRTPNERR